MCRCVVADERVRVRLLLAYDGSGFRGFAPNPGVPTVGGVLGESLERILRHPVALTCAGRTDAGVHAQGQVVTFDADPERVDVKRLAGSLNAMCGPAVVIGDVTVAEPGFDARFDARSRTYRYSVLNAAVADPLTRHTSWLITAPIDHDVMREASEALLGQHDFSSFCRRKVVTGHDGGEVEASRVRTIRRAEWCDLGEGRLRFEIEASSFCQQMVRAIVGTLTGMGIGRRPVERTRLDGYRSTWSAAEEVAAVLAARDRTAAGDLAPPHGLCLWAVSYEEPVAVG